MTPPVEMVTDDGYDAQWGTMVLGPSLFFFASSLLALRVDILPPGHYYLTMLLTPLLITTVSASAPGTVRVVNTSSISSYMGKVDFDSLIDRGAKNGGKPSKKRSSLGSEQLYNQSKVVRLFSFISPL
jgi:retinol dehydrogenase 12